MHNGDNHFWNCFVGEECNSTITCVLQNSILLDIFKHYDPHGCSFLWVLSVRVKWISEYMRIICQDRVICRNSGLPQAHDDGMILLITPKSVWNENTALKRRNHMSIWRFHVWEILSGLGFAYYGFRKGLVEARQKEKQVFIRDPVFRLVMQMEVWPILAWWSFYFSYLCSILTDE